MTLVFNLLNVVAFGVTAAGFAPSPTNIRMAALQEPERECAERKVIVYDDGRIVRSCAKWKAKPARDTTPAPAPSKPQVIEATENRCSNGRSTRRGLDGELYSLVDFGVRLARRK